jgi:SAM-dependent methyltransferase
MQKAWYEEWFDSPYYHILYKDRNVKEARAFIDQLLDFLELEPPGKVLDLACGHGRHSRYLAYKGFDVTGLDLSEQSIQFAKAFESGQLSFFKHDMRRPFRVLYFDAVFNFFTSFGYFEKEEDDLNVLKNVAVGLKKNGLFILDFLNAHLLRRQLQEHTVKTVEGIRFNISRSIANDFVIKDIQFTDRGQDFFFQEKVRLLMLEDFRLLFEQVGLELFHTFGNYQLDPFEESESPRLILIAKKKT